jgi:hypothetical protein
MMGQVAIVTCIPAFSKEKAHELAMRRLTEKMYHTSYSPTNRGRFLRFRKRIESYIAQNPNNYALTPTTPLSNVATWFAQEYTGKYDSPHYSTDQCIKASKKFKAYLDNYGFASVLMEATCPCFDVSKAQPKWDRAQIDGWKHVFVVCQGLTVDFTLRQFEPSAGYPHIEPWEQTKTKWGSILPYHPKDEEDKDD